MRNEELVQVAGAVDLGGVTAVDREGWKRVLLTLTGVAIATVVSVLILTFAANASPSASSAPPARTAR